MYLSGFSYLTVIEVLGTVTFAISGSTAAMESRYDLFGIFVLAFVTAIGGGTIRDLIIGNLPVSWVTDFLPIGSIFGGFLVTIILRRRIKKIQTWIFFFDAAGLGLFTVTGIQVGLEANMSIGIAIALGTITGCFGGVIRDILSRRPPFIFRNVIYATASVIGGLLYVGMLSYLNIIWAQSIAIISIIVIRITAFYLELKLPQFEDDLKAEEAS